MHEVNCSSESEWQTTRDIFPCIVCSLETNSIEELHHHQRQFHSTAELSLSVIYLVHYMCLKSNNNDILGNGFDAPIAKHSLPSSAQINDDNSNDNYPQDYSMKYNADNKHDEKPEIVETAVKLEHVNESPTPCESIVCEKYSKQDNGQVSQDRKVVDDDYKSLDLSTELTELYEFYEISDDSFNKSIEEISNQLKMLDEKKKNGKMPHSRKKKQKIN